ncbi:hypothetical protein GGR57DRAFT_477696 [Xylariaceae sp. FL1272]|nr:hypothetical protein GGR57DRAFT_477696 [Xylariaceae sp. FL1272]
MDLPYVKRILGLPQRSTPEGSVCTIDEILLSLDRLCAPPRHRETRISDKQIRGIQTYLQILDERSNRRHENKWNKRPRLYTILHHIHATMLMDDFIREQLTDFHLPFNEQTLPSFIGEKDGRDLRAAFFKFQEYCLTDVKDIESDKSRHLTLSVTGDTYYVPLRPLGHGSFGGVDLVFSRLSTEKYARKRVLRGRGTEESQKYLIQELKQLATLHHLHLVQVIGSYTDIQYIAYLMKPVAEETLAEFVGKPRLFTGQEKVILRTLYGCLTGAMNYLHSHRIRHRDLTTRNILLDSAGKVYISDFGSAHNWNTKASSKTRHRNIPTSPDFMAPEVAKGDKRGSKSDMWSLGMVFLEMTTKLLDRRVGDLKKKIEKNAKMTRMQAYPYANIGVLNSWMKTLGNSDTSYDHDREPLVWVKELLHLEPDHRVTPPQLMRYIHESPSFHVFSCFECAGEFDDEAFAYSHPKSNGGLKEESMRTREEIEALFAPDLPSHGTGHISWEREDSVQKWINDSRHLDGSLVELPADAVLDDNDVVEEDVFFDTVDVDQLLYSTYEHEFYYPTTALETSFDPNNRLDTVPQTPLDKEEQIAELLGDTVWPEDRENDTRIHFKVDEGAKNLQDPEMGFLEVISNSTDEDNPGLPFEEICDMSSVGSEEENSSQIRSSALTMIHQMSEPKKEDIKKIMSPPGEKDFLFEEEEDNSESENPWEESSDRCKFESSSSASDVPTSRPVYHMVEDEVDGDLPHANESNTIILESEPIENSHDSLNDSVSIQGYEHEPSAEEVQGAGETLCGTHDTDSNLQEKNTGPESSELIISPSLTEESYGAEILGQDTQIPSNTFHETTPNDLLQKATGTRSRPYAISPLELTRLQELENPAPLLTETITNESDASISQNRAPRPYQMGKDPKKVKLRKTARISEEVNIIPDAHCDANNEQSGIPEITIDPPLPEEQEESHKLSEANMSAFSKENKVPRVPRRRHTLMPLDVGKLISNTWDMASSAPTSVLSEDSKSKISSFFFMIPSTEEIERMLSVYCKKGSASAVRTILQKVMSPNKRLKPRQFLVPLIYAVQGASGRHNKCVRALLAAGVSPNHKSRKSGLTPLHMAVRHSNFKGYANLVWLLLSNNANPNMLDRDGEYPLASLFVGADTEHLEPHKRGALIMLLREGAEPNFKLWGTGTTPLHLAVRRQDSIVVAMLLHKNANVNAKTTSGITPLQMTANQFRGELSADHAEVLDHLLQYGADVDGKAGALDRTALHWAVTGGCAHVVTRLLEAGADPKETDQGGLNAMGLAIQEALKMDSNDEDKIMTHSEIMSDLQKAANYGWKLEEGKCAVETACQNNNTQLLGRLIAAGLSTESKFGSGTVKDFALRAGSEAVKRYFAAK